MSEIPGNVRYRIDRRLVQPKVALKLTVELLYDIKVQNYEMENAFTVNDFKMCILQWKAFLCNCSYLHVYFKDAIDDPCQYVHYHYDQRHLNVISFRIHP